MAESVTEGNGILGLPVTAGNHCWRWLPSPLCIPLQQVQQAQHGSRVVRMRVDGAGCIGYMCYSLHRSTVFQRFRRNGRPLRVAVW